MNEHNATKCVIDLRNTLNPFENIQFDLYYQESLCSESMEPSTWSGVHTFYAGKVYLIELVKSYNKIGFLLKKWLFLFAFMLGAMEVNLIFVDNPSSKFFKLKAYVALKVARELFKEMNFLKIWCTYYLHKYSNRDTSNPLFIQLLELLFLCNWQIKRPFKRD